MDIRADFGDAPRRLSDQVASFLREEIYSGRLRPGERLAEVELCERLDISRAPLREAILALRTDGLVDIRPHRGATVTELTETDIREVYGLRLLLEPVAAREAASRRDPADLAHIEAQFEELRAAMVRENPLPVALAHAGFHRAVARASGMPRMASFIDVLCTQMLACHGVGYAMVPAQIDSIVEDHAPLLDAIRSGDEERAEEAMREHFRPIDPMVEAYASLGARDAPDA